MKIGGMRDVLFGGMLLLAVSHAKAQQGFGTNKPSTVSAIEMHSGTKGLLIPRVPLISKTEFTPIKGGSGVNGASAETNSLLVYNTASSTSAVPAADRVSPGYYYWTVGDGSSTFGRWNRLLTTADWEATNGVRMDQGKVKLGGSLTEETTIDAAQYNLKVPGLKLGHSQPSGDQVVLVATDGTLKKANAAMPQFFYAPAVYIPTHDQNAKVLNGPQMIDLYAEYAKQFGGTETTTFVRSNPQSSLPVLEAKELDYFVTYYDTTVFEQMAISPEGKLTYKVKSTAVVTAKTFMNIVFKIKD